MQHNSIFILLLTGILSFGSSVFAEDDAKPRGIRFRADIVPILLSQCHGCHNDSTTEGSYNLGTFTKLMEAGDSGDAPVVAGEPLASELFRRLTTSDVDERMPADADPLPEDSIELVREWIEQGARFDAVEGQDRNAPLASLLPVTRHPEAPSTYAFPIPVTSLLFRGDTLLVGGYHEVIGWDLQQNKIAQRIGQVGQRVYSMTWLEDKLVVGSGTPGLLGEVRVFDLDSGTLVAVPLVTNEVVLDVEVDPAGKTLAVASADSKIHLLSVAQNRLLKRIDSHSDWVRAVAWNPSGTQLASASRDKTAKVFDVETGKPVASYTGHAEDVMDVCFAADGKSLVSCDAVGKLQSWDPEKDKKLSDLPTRGKQAFRLLLTNGDAVWLASSNAHVSKFSIGDAKETQKIGPHAAHVLSIAIDAAGKRLATGDVKGHVRVWNLEDGKLLHEFVAVPVDSEPPRNDP